MTIPLNDTRRIFEANKEALTLALNEVAASGQWVLGPKSAWFAQAFANLCGTRFCLPVANGTDALELALRAALDLEQDLPEVITVANAGGYTTTACRLVGAVPVYVDVDASNLLLDLSQLTAALGRHTQAIVVTHLYGAVVDVSEVKRILERQNFHHIVIIEDCAQAHGAASPNGQQVGTLGDLATFSFYPTKNLPAMGDGGAIVTSSRERYALLKQLHQYGWERKYEVHRACGRNSRLDEIQAAALLTLLPYLNDMNARRRAIWATYRETGGDGVTWCEHGLDGGVAHLAVGRVNKRDEFRRFMSDRGIATDVHYPILDCDQRGWQNLPMRVIGDLPNSRKAVAEIVSLPCFPHMTTEELSYVCDVLRSWRGN